MKRKPGAIQGRQTVPILRGPDYDDSSLLVTLKAHPGISGAAQAFTEGHVAPGSPLFPLLNHLRENREAASLVTLYPERAERVWSGENWQVALPGLTARDADLAGLHHLQLASPEAWEQVAAALIADSAVVSATRPVIHYPADTLEYSVGAAPFDKQWGLGTCKFRDVWPRLDTGAHPGPIAVVDQGGIPNNLELLQRVTEPPIPRTRPPSDAIHAGEVMGVIAARRDDQSGFDGCCSAMIELYNVWGNDAKYDSRAYHAALAAVASSKARVLNVSLGSTIPCPKTESQFRDILARGITVVAAMGDRAKEGSPEIFPAAFDGVIAVGATDVDDIRPNWASRGGHMWIAAPGENILTIMDDELDIDHGTSFATPMVASAVWLALRTNTKLSRAEIMCLLADAVDGPGKRTPDLGYGRLNMEKLAQKLGV